MLLIFFFFSVFIFIWVLVFLKLFKMGNSFFKILFCVFDMSESCFFFVFFLKLLKSVLILSIRFLLYDNFSDKVVIFFLSLVFLFFTDLSNDLMLVIFVLLLFIKVFLYKFNDVMMVEVGFFMMVLLFLLVESMLMVLFSFFY